MRRWKKALVVGILLLAVLVPAIYAYVSTQPVKVSNVTLSDFSITASKMTIYNMTQTTINVTNNGVKTTEYSVYNGNVTIVNMTLTKYVNGTVSANIITPLAKGIGVLLYATSINASSSSYTNMSVSEGPPFTIHVGIVVLMNVTIHATYQFAKSFVFTKTGIGISMLTSTIAADLKQARSYI